ncbi:unnamed protein product [Hermetia illucens]|uniref:Peptidase S1 domain-containing protein n=1 Tax=Hermetia illucens TaxID=343691 RepID=A0A7R8YUC1_HERIL|nr:unnamed protein product [Hermetia illucens]
MIIILPIGKFNVDNLIRFTITLFVNFMVLLSKDQIVEGSDASPAQFPSQVSLRFGTLGHYCGGSLLTLNDVLTAAHCASYGIRMMRRYVVVVAGEVKSEKKNSLSRQESTVKSVAVHPLYDCKSFKNDIAIIKSNDQFNETSYVKPLPRISSKPEIGQECYVVGWGSADPTLMGEIAETLQYTLVGIKHGFACDSFDKKQPYFVEEMICAEALTKRGVCMVT